MSGKYDHIDFTPPAGAQAAAKRALEVRAEKPPSERGMTPTGIARARDLANGTTLSPETVRRMLSFFQRHEVDKSGETWASQGKGWQAWNGWGGDAGYAWARKVVRQMDAADEKSMSTRTLRAEGFAITFSDETIPAVGHTTWNQIARFGEYRGHPQGAFVFDAACFARIIANFAATQNGRVPVDYEHTSEALPENVAQEGVPAVAWVTALEDRGAAGLWAAFEWVDPQAVEYVRARRYLYVSPAVNFGAIDRASGDEIGPRLTSVALTNHPFLDGMKPLVASEPAAVTASETTHLGLAPAAVHIPAGVEVAPRKELTTMDEMEALKAKYDAMKASYDNSKMRIAKMADMDPEAGEDAALEAIQKIVDAMKAGQKAEAETMADAVCASGRVPAEGRADLVALCLSDRARFDRMFPADAVKPATPTGDAKLLLSSRVGGDKMPSAESAVEIESADPLAESRVVDAMASKLLSDKKASTYSEALALASRARHEQVVNSALARLKR